MDKLLWLLLAFVAGAVLPIQGALNNKFGRVLTSPVHASMISFCVGAIVLIGYIAVSRQDVVLSGFKTAPTYVWLAGALGAFYVTAVIYAFPRIGPALTFSIVVAGQLVVAVALEHFDVLVAQPHRINVMRSIGILLVLAGVVIIRKF